MGSGLIIKKAIQKYGLDNFRREVLCECNSKTELEDSEILYIKELNTIYPNGYNISRTSFGGNYIENHPDKDSIVKHRLKMVRSFVRSAEWKRRIGDRSRGVPLTEEHKDKIRATKANNPYKHSPEIIALLKSKLIGRKMTEEQKIKISNSLSGKPKTKEHNEKVKQSLLGKKRPHEVVNKMSISMKKKYNEGWVSPVQIEVHQYDKGNGNYIQSFKSATIAGKVLNIDRKAITNNCIGKTKSSGGFIWSKTKKGNVYE